MEKYKPYAFLFLAGFLYTLGFPNLLGIYLPFTPIIATAILIFHLFKASSTKKRIIYYLFYNSVINGLSFYWVTATLQEFGNLPFIVAALMNVLFALIFNPQYFALIFILHFASKHERLTAYFFKWGIFNVGLAALMTAMEYYIPQQFPVMLGQPWIILSEYLGAARFLGLPVFSFMSYLLAMEIIRGYSHKKLSNINLFSILFFIVINPFLVNWENSKDTIDYNVRLVQANISNFLKVDSEEGGYASVAQVLNRYKSLSNEAYTVGKRPDLIVWPETAYPYPIKTNKDNLMATVLPQLFIDVVDKTNSPILFGGYDHYRDSPDSTFYQTEYNSALYINELGHLDEVYHKHVLIPFGETLPLGPLTKWSSKLVPEMAFFAIGSKFPVFETDKGVNFISSICYEILRPEFVRDYLNSATSRPHLMINLTNDSWYGNTVEPEQHLFLTRWRAIEFNLPILRSTNTGISTFIDRLGREVKRLEYGKTGNLDLTLKLPAKAESLTPTLFQEWGFWGIIPLWLLYFIFHTILIKLKYD